MRNKFPLRAALLGLCLGTTLSACNLQPHYTRPQAPISTQWPADAPTTSGKTAAAVLGWNAYFTDPAIRQLIALALANNRDLRVAAQNVEVARGQYGVTRAALMPNISTSVTDTGGHIPRGLYSTSSSGAVSYHVDEASVGFTSYEVDFFGKLRNETQQGLESYLAIEGNRRTAQISLVAEVATAYLTLCSDRDLLALALQTQKSQQDSYDITHAKYVHDVATSQDLSEAEISLRDAQADIARYRQQVSEDTHALHVLVGGPLPDGLLAQASLQRDIPFADIPSGLPSDLLTQRPDIVAAEHNLKAANANIGAARAAFFPSITLTASAGSESGYLHSLFGAGSGAWTFAPSISLPIFDGGRNQGNLDVAKAQKITDVANYEKAIQTAFKEVADALSARTNDRDLYQARALDNAANELNYKTARMRYDAGVDGYLGVLVAQRSTYGSRQSLIAAQLQQATNRVTLYKVLGGGWQ
ncbi:MAG: efflux transporter outer membrane subunit [Janthinobacterium lividum]